MRVTVQKASRTCFQLRMFALLRLVPPQCPVHRFSRKWPACCLQSEALFGQKARAFGCACEHEREHERGRDQAWRVVENDVRVAFIVHHAAVRRLQQAAPILCVQFWSRMAFCAGRSGGSKRDGDLLKLRHGFL